MRGKAGLKDRSTSGLVNQMWDSLIMAWLGTSAGVIMILGSIFWRFVIRPPSLVIRYSDDRPGNTVWSFDGELYRQALPPELPATDNVILVACLIVGVAICFVSSEPWREAARELKRRRHENRAQRSL